MYLTMGVEIPLVKLLLFLRQCYQDRETERCFVHWFIPQKATEHRLGQAEDRSQGLHLDLPFGFRNQNS